MGSWTSRGGLAAAFGAWALASPANATLRFSGAAPQGQEAREIRVQVVAGAASVRLAGLDLKLSDRLGTRTLGGVTRWELRCAAGHVVFLPDTDRPPSPSAPVRRPFHRPEKLVVSGPAGLVAVDGRGYHGRVEVRARGDLCQVINPVDLEKYLAGVVNAEFRSKWSDESVRAQIVAARTYALYQMGDAGRRGREWDLDSTVRDQVYEGAWIEDARSARLVESTRGLILTAPGPGGGQPIKAYYHSTCGGLTELPETVWGRHEPGFRSRVRCGFCNESPRFAWESDISPDEMAHALRGFLKVRGGAELVSVQVAASRPSGRVSDVITTWRAHPAPSAGAGEQQLKLPALKFREILGSDRIRSTDFSLERGPRGRFHVEGRGFGHGVGMCQWGAKVMGDRGYSMESILARYYPDAKLVRRW